LRKSTTACRLLLKPNQFEDWLRGNMGAEELKPVENDYLQRWPVSKRINSSKADSNDPTLIDAVRQAA
jgi:putative SOS response-associated peptidase YedK